MPISSKASFVDVTQEGAGGLFISIYKSKVGLDLLAMEIYSNIPG
jgi:hypothetical protein